MENEKSDVLGGLGDRISKNWLGLKEKRLIFLAHTDVPNIFTRRHAKIKKIFFLAVCGILKSFSNALLKDAISEKLGHPL